MPLSRLVVASVITNALRCNINRLLKTFKATRTRCLRDTEQITADYCVVTTNDGESFGQMIPEGERPEEVIKEAAIRTWGEGVVDQTSKREPNEAEKRQQILSAIGDLELTQFRAMREAILNNDKSKLQEIDDEIVRLRGKLATEVADVRDL